MLVMAEKCTREGACHAIHRYVKANNNPTKLTRSIPGIFAECSLSVTMFRACREHLGNILKENIFLKILDGKVVFVLKV